MHSKFYPVTLKEKEQFYELWFATPQRSLDYSLVNLWGWQEYYGLEWQFAQGLCWIRQNRPEPVWWAPLGDWEKADWGAIFAECFNGQKQFFTRVPSLLADIWQRQLAGQIAIEEDRGQWEYLYLQKDLATLAGPKYHKKKNHYNSYVKAYGEPDYEPISDNIIEQVLGVQDDWCQWHECEGSPSLRAENEAINRCLAHWDNFRNMCGGALTVDGKMIAFSVGEKLDEETLGAHFEKGLGGYKGVYQAINLEFARHAGEGFKWIDRAQDLDEEGLRQAKMTYHPADFLRKFRIVTN